MFDPAKSNLVAEFKAGTPLLSCAFSPCGRFLFAGGRDRDLVLVDLATQEQRALSGHESWVGAMTRAAEELVLTVDYAGRVIAWDCGGEALPAPRWQMEAHPGTIHGISVSADGQRFATAGQHGHVRIWATIDGQLLAELPPIDQPVYGVALHPDGQRIVTADRQPQKPRLKVWDIASAKEQLSLEVTELSGYRRVEDIEWSGIRGIALTPGGNLTVACGRHGYDGPPCALVYETGSGKLVRKLISNLKGGFYYLASFHPDGLLLTAGGDIGKGEFRFWDPAKDEAVAIVATAGPCTSLALHPDGLRIAATQTVGKGSYPDSGVLSLYRCGD